MLEVCSVDKNGTKSLPISNYARPYTENHEVVRTFTKGITKFYKGENYLAYFMDTWSDNIEEISLNYFTKSPKEIKSTTLNESDFHEGFHYLKNVDTEEKIYVLRKGKIADCPDVLTFDTLFLGNERIYTSDFKNAIQVRYGKSDKSAEQKVELEHFIDTVTVLEFDYNMTTFEDVLYCPKLEKIVLGKNRYLEGTYTTDADQSLLYDEERSIKALNAAYELNGVVVECYNKHYFEDAGELKCWVDKGKTELPYLEYVSASKVDTITCSVVNQDEYLEDLLDNRMDTYWESTAESNTVRTYELLIALKSVERIRGIKIVQALFNPEADRDSKYYTPGSVIIKTSTNQQQWTNVTFMEENTLGKGSGESTLLPIAEGEREVKYIKVTVVDGVKGNIARVKLADIVPYY